MWSLISTILGILAKIFGVGKPDPEKTGEDLGRAETALKEKSDALADATKANQIGQAVGNMSDADLDRGLREFEKPDERAVRPGDSAKGQ